MSEAGRRSYDREIDPVIETFVENTMRDNRHLLRGEFTAAAVGLTNKINSLADMLTQAHVQQVEDHAKVNGKLDQLSRDIQNLLPLLGRVTELEGNERADDAVTDALDRYRVSARNWMLGLAGLIVAATGVLAGLLAG